MNFCSIPQIIPRSLICSSYAMLMNLIWSWAQMLAFIDPRSPYRWDEWTALLVKVMRGILPSLLCWLGFHYVCTSIKLQCLQYSSLVWLLKDWICIKQASPTPLPLLFIYCIKIFLLFQFCSEVLVCWGLVEFNEKVEQKSMKGIGSKKLITKIELDLIQDVQLQE